MAATSLGRFSTFKGPEIPKSKTLISSPKRYNLPLTVSFPPQSHSQSHKKKRTTLRIAATSISTTSEEVRTSPDDLVATILSKVTGTDRGVSLTEDGHKEVAKVAQLLQNYCVDEPVKCPLIFGEWDVLYCSVPTSPGGGYRSALGRLVFKTNEMIQVVEAPACVKNKVSFSAFGFLDGEVSLKGELKVLDEKWIQVIFEPPELKVGGLKFQYGGESEVKLAITYVDEKIRLGMGSRGSLFVFQRRG
ncbi:Plastid lipid-associated protein/fibrillin conserved domain [Macleaya cordata]|uniref:Plastid lipid-associated protein/fibrillin conserved domain n=1 Tax=Macleaya cordata TaxID=56857 RepID=A0A200QZ99_MACCD|nr:Plastid lipid-associated protein/fibrillin conserved domain [Macleaya cordata]